MKVLVSNSSIAAVFLNMFGLVAGGGLLLPSMLQRPWFHSRYAGKRGEVAVILLILLTSKLRTVNVKHLQCLPADLRQIHREPYCPLDGTISPQVLPSQCVICSQHACTYMEIISEG